MPPNCDDGICSNGTETYNTDTCECNSGTPPTPCQNDGDCSNGEEQWNDASCECETVNPIFGCTNTTANNYDPLATCDDNSCEFDCPAEPCDDGDCTNGIEFWDGNICGCVNGTPPNSNCNDGDCSNGEEIWDPQTCVCLSGTPPEPCIDDGDCTNGFEEWDDLLCDCNITAAQFGCIDMNAENYNPAANCSDDSCTYSCTLVADAGPDQSLDCENTTVTLGSNNSSSGPNTSYQWIDENGNIVSSELIFQTMFPGSYTLIVIDSDQDCQIQSQEVIVSDNTSVPFANIVASPDSIFDCTVQLITLNADNPGIQAASFKWTIANQESAGSTITVDESGEVILEVLDMLTGCTSFDTLQIQDGEEYPIINIEAFINIDCNNEEGFIDASNSQTGGNISHQWYDIDGNIITGEDGLTININQEGTYILESSDSSNGCINQDTITILNNSTSLFIEAGPDDFIECEDANIILNATDLNDPQENYIYNWITEGGSILSGSNTLSPTVNGEGWYYLQLTDDLTGCSAIDSLFIEDFQSDIVFTVDKPAIELDLGDQEQVELETNLNTAEIDTLIWMPTEGVSCLDCFNPILNPESSTIYTVTIIDQNGCSSTLTIRVEVDNTIDIYIPNIINLEQFGENDVLTIYSDKVEEVEELNIYDRWGNMIFMLENFKPNDNNIGWHGKTQNDENVSQGVYVYFFNYIDIAGINRIATGDVTVIGN